MATQNYYGDQYEVERARLDRQRQQAEMLRQQSMTPSEGQMVSGHYIAPSWTQGLAKIMQGVAGKSFADQADTAQSDLLKRRQDAGVEDVNAYVQALKGAPAAAEVQGNNPSAYTPPQAAVSPDRSKAMAIALRSQNPMLQQAGGQMLNADADQAQLAQILGMGGAAGGTPGASGAAPGMGAPAGGIPGVDPLAMALLSSRNPGFQKLGDAYQTANKPINITEGGTVLDPKTRQPVFTAPKTEAGIGINGGQAAPIPGFQEAQARKAALIAQAEGNAKAGLETVTVDTPQGPRMMTKAQALQLAGGQGAPQPQVAQQLPAPEAGLTGNFQGNPQAIARSIANIRDPQERANAMAAYQAQMQGGAAPTAAPGGPGIALQDEASKAFNSARAKDFAAAASDYQKGGRSAGANMRNLDALEQLYKDPNVTKGAAAESISGLKNLAASAGIDIKGLGSEQAIEAITNKMALDSRSTADGGGMPGAMSDADRNFLKAQTPGLSKTPEGRALIIATSKALAMRQQQVAQLANEYEQRNGRLDAGFDRELQNFSSQNPMFDKLKQQAAQPSDLQSAIQAEIARRRGAAK